MPIIDFDISQLTSASSRLAGVLQNTTDLEKALRVAAERTLERMKAEYAYHNYTGAANSKMVIEPHYKELYADVGLPASVIPVNPSGWAYPAQIEMGSRGPYRRMPPFEPIRAWAMRKLGVGNREARNIWMAIGRKGTEPYMDFLDMAQSPRFMNFLEEEVLAAFGHMATKV